MVEALQLYHIFDVGSPNLASTLFFGELTSYICKSEALLSWWFLRWTSIIKQESFRKHLLLLYMPKSLTVWTATNSGKFLKRWEYQNTWPASWEICMQVRKQQLELEHEKINWSQTGKGVSQGCILSPCLFNLYAEYIMRNTGLEEAQAGIRIAGRNINNLRYADDTTLMAESEEELKSLLMKVKEWKSWLKTQHLEN